MTQVTVAEVLLAARKGLAPLAPESAGYLTLAVADALARAPQSLSASEIALSTEGTVSVPRGGVSTALDSERALRSLLASLLSTSPNSTPALGAAARREASAGVSSLISELEGALIPVNRSAARRALARLARETDRVKQAGGLRSSSRASSRPPPKPAPPVAEPLRAPSIASAPAAPPNVASMVPASSEPEVSSAESFFSEQPHVVPDAPAPPLPAQWPVAQESALPTFEASPDPAVAAEAPEPTDVDALPTLAVAESLPTLDAADELTVPLPPPSSRSSLPRSTPRLLFEPVITLVPGTTPSPPTTARLFTNLPEHHSPEPPIDITVGTPVPREIAVEVAEVAPPPASAPTPKLATAPAASVESLLEGFVAADRFDERAAALALKRSVGLDATPPPPETRAHAVAPREEPAMAPLMSPSPLPASVNDERRPPRAPRASRALMFGMLVLALGATVAVWVEHPGFFTGHLAVDAPPAVDGRVRDAR
jgi:hypothetical protein